MEINPTVSIRQYYKFLVLSMGGTGVCAKIIQLWSADRAVMYLLEGLLLIFVFSALALSRYHVLKILPKRRDVLLLLGAPGMLFLFFLLSMGIDDWR
ncbi:MAG: hypothetical protein ACE15F_22705 [bacterium]